MIVFAIVSECAFVCVNVHARVHTWFMCCVKACLRTRVCICTLMSV